MHFENLATELVSHIFLFCPSIEDVLALSSTCFRFRHIYQLRKLSLLEAAAEYQHGPLDDLTQLLTHNASQPAHIARSVPFSIALLKQIVQTGRVAEKWCDIYPFKKWKYNFEDRRLLSTEERYRLRRALYRYWLYSRAFHNESHSRGGRMNLLVMQERATLLHNWTTDELAEVADIHSIIREVVNHNVCPSNGTIGRKFRKRHPDNDAAHQLLFNIHLNYPPPSAAIIYSQYHASPDSLTHISSTSTTASKLQYAKYAVTASHNPGSEGWGDDIPHYYVVEDMMKLDPGEVMWLMENAPFKSQVEDHVKRKGEWFQQNGQTWGQTLEYVLGERGEDVEEVLGAVQDGELGVAIAD